MTGRKENEGREMAYLVYETCTAARARSSWLVMEEVVGCLMRAGDDDNLGEPPSPACMDQPMPISRASTLEVAARSRA